MPSPSLPVRRPVARPPGAPARVVDIPSGDVRLQRALSWWQGLCMAAPQRLPDRQQIEPEKIVELLPHSMLWDVLYGEDGTRQYRCRLAGTMLEEIYGRCSARLTLNEMYGDEAATMQRLFDRVADTRQPLCSHHDMSWAQKDFYHYHRLSLPFTLHSRSYAGEEPDRVDLLFNVVSFIAS